MGDDYGNQHRPPMLTQAAEVELPSTGTVVRWASRNVVVQLHDEAGRFGTGQLRCPPLGLEHLT